MGTSKTREAKIQWLKKVIVTYKGLIISKEKLLSEFCLQNNSSMKTANEILKLLEQTKLIKINGDEVIKK